MRIEILSVGNELLSGEVVNTNEAMIARLLLDVGYTVGYMATLPDERGALREKMAEMTARADVVLVTGGLGPTEDDVTRDAAADVVRRPLVTDAETLKQLQKRFQDEAIWRRQATFPKGARLLPNALGTAVGFAAEVNGSSLIVLPGVPKEMEMMLRDDVLPLLNKKSAPRWRRRSFFFCLKFEFEFDAALSGLKKSYPSLEVGSSLSHGIVALHIVAQVENKRGERALRGAEKEAKALFPGYLFSTESIAIEKAVHGALRAQRKTLALAESCTGGALTARLTALAGISEVLLGSVISYANAAKSALLGVDKAVIEAHGAVSQEVVVAMAKGVLNVTGAHLALATSGVAGPSGGTKEKPVGTVWVAFGVKEGEVYSHCLYLRKTLGRKGIIDFIVTYLFASLWRYLVHGVLPFEEIKIR